MGEDAEEGEEKQREGKVVYVENPVWKSGKKFPCNIHPNRPEKLVFDANGEVDLDHPSLRMVQEGEKFIRAQPLDSRFPWVKIFVNDITKRILNIPRLPLDRQMVWPIAITKWDSKSDLPLGILKGEALGDAMHSEAAVKRSLMENELDLSHEGEFTRESYQEVQEMVKQRDEEIASEIAAGRRLDLSKGKFRERIFTIDPATARDLDDAIHMKEIGGGVVEVGVHIADVSHYLKIGTVTDREAQRRCTSLYAPTKVFPMLPEGLSNDLCSLNPAEPKMTFSAFFFIDRKSGHIFGEGSPHPPRFAKSVIESCCRLNYDEVQVFFDAEEVGGADPLEDCHPPVTNGFTWKQIKEDLVLMKKVCTKIRNYRFHPPADSPDICGGGSLMIEKVKLLFKLNEDGLPVKIDRETHSASHWVVEELMLAANKVVASQLHSAPDPGISSMAVLRNHIGPDKEKREKLKIVLEKAGISGFDPSSPAKLFKFLKKIRKKASFELARTVESLVMRTMKPAEYICSDASEELGDDNPDPLHFALAFPLYTHFTSPIRRYADVMVHRQLFQFLEKGRNQMEKEKIQDQCKLCNDMKNNARKAQWLCDRLFFAIYVYGLKEAWPTIGVVTDLGKEMPKKEELAIELGEADERAKNQTPELFIPSLDLTDKVQCDMSDEMKAKANSDKAGKYQLSKSLHQEDRLAAYLPKEIEPTCPGSLATVYWVTRKGAIEHQKLKMFDYVPCIVAVNDQVPKDVTIRLMPPDHPMFPILMEEIKEKKKK